jgi:hypothetical protein
MKLFEIEIGRNYKCDRFGNQYFGIVKEKRDGQIGVVLGNRVGADDLAERPRYTRTRLARARGNSPFVTQLNAALARSLPRCTIARMGATA